MQPESFCSWNSKEQKTEAEKSRNRFYEPNLLIPNHLLIQQKEEVTDWRKNVDAMSGMEGRKKLFDAGQ